MTRTAAIFIIVAALLVSGAMAGTSGTAFTYQGELKSKGSLVTGVVPMDFSIWDAPAAGTQVTAVESLDVDVVAGRFTVELDFGAAPFSGEARWLNIVVNGAPLVPRQVIASTPYAIHTRGIHVNDDASFVGIGRDDRVSVSEVFGIFSPATNTYGGMYVECAGQNAWPFYGYAAGPLADMWHYYEGSTGSWHIHNGGADRFTLESGGEVGIGTRTPAAPLHVQDGGAGAVTPHFNSSAVFERDSTNYVSILSPNNAERGVLFGDPESFVNGGIIYNSGSTPDGLQVRTGNNQTRMVIDADGDVGIGATAPLARLHVNGSYYGQGFVTLHALDGDGATGTAYIQAGDATSTSSVGLRLRTKAGSTIREVLYLSPSGAAGIGTIGPEFTLHVNGTAGKPGGGSWSSASDARLKKNIHDLDGALDSLLKLRGVTFEYLNPRAVNEPEGTRIGMIAQEVESVFPDWVSQRSDGFRSVTFRGFEALTVEALRELRAEKDAEIARLQECLHLADERYQHLLSRLESLEQSVKVTP